ncbi:MAG: PKD domain-containing protein [Bacteroidales bacterium]
MKNSRSNIQGLRKLFRFKNSKLLLTVLVFLFGNLLSAQPLTKRVLFLGNSYTDVNNLPQMLSDVCTSMGDVLIFDSNNPGGYTLQGHSTNATSVGKIMLGNWDYVVLQEQSQLPSFPASQVESEVFPYAKTLDSIINVYNSCGETVFYMTWGRKNGDASNCAFWPPVCTYEGMDSLLNLRYRMMADSNHAILSPVGAVWHYVRQNFPSIELYQSDESHPSIAGTYLAACTFYTSLFRKDPVSIPFISTITASEAANIRNAVKIMVYDSLMNWHIGEYDYPLANFIYHPSGSNQLSFTNTSTNAISYKWSFGDGNSSVMQHPVHQYANTGTYTVRLISANCKFSDTTYQVINVYTTIINPVIYQSINWKLSPNPVSTVIQLKLNGISNLTYKILNVSGAEVQNGEINTSDYQINVSSLTAGVYFLSISGKEKFYGQQKFIKK